MIHLVATLLSLMLAIGALALIGTSLTENWAALRRALGAATAPSAPPPRTRRIIGARRARIVRISLESSRTRAAA